MLTTHAFHLETAAAPPLETSVVRDIAVLSQDEAAAAVATLFELRSHWVARNLYAPFYTLGAASYLDATTATRWRYAAWREEGNSLLEAYFAPLYRQVRTALQIATGEPVVYAPGLALPGFHIYLSSPLFEKPVASIHFDSQYDLHEWPKGADKASPLSFTLSLALPKSGGGLRTWGFSRSQIAGKSTAEVASMAREENADFHPYYVGHLAVHSGHVLHQAAPGRTLGPDDMRITLQGHGVRVDGTWQMYW